MAQHENRKVTIWGWKVTSRTVRTDNNREMKFLTLEDHYGLMEVVFFPDVYNRYHGELQGFGPFAIEVTLKQSIPGDVTLVALRVRKINMDNSVTDNAV